MRITTTLRRKAAESHQIALAVPRVRQFARLNEEKTEKDQLTYAKRSQSSLLKFPLAMKHPRVDLHHPLDSDSRMNLCGPSLNCSKIT